MIQTGTANIALIQYQDGEKAYILAPEGIKVGDAVENGVQADIKPGNCMPIEAFPVGTIIHNIGAQSRQRRLRWSAPLVLVPS